MNIKPPIPDPFEVPRPKEPRPKQSLCSFDGLKCPYCGCAIALTWKRYFSAPTGVHTCPECQQKSKLSRTRTYVIWQLIQLIGVAVLIFVPILVTGFRFDVFILSIAVAVALGFFFDRYFDEHTRELMKLP